MNVEHHDHLDMPGSGSGPGGGTTAVLEMKGLHWASESALVETTLGRLPGVRSVEANPVSQTATVSYDAAKTSVAELRRWVEDCGFHCNGQSVPGHVCHPMDEPAGMGQSRGPAPSEEHQGHEGHEGHQPSVLSSPHDAMGHGGDRKSVV